MSEEKQNERQKLHEDRVFKSLEILLHAEDNKEHNDLNCPHHVWMGEDLTHCSGVGEWKCKLQEYYYASDQYGLDSKDYKQCSFKNHSECELYQNRGK